MKPVTSQSVRPAVSIIIPVFNKSALTVQCLQSLAQNTSGISYEVIVVDNASTDDTSVRLREFEPAVQTIRNVSNLGFAKACNQGAAAARGEFLLFLNNDTIPTKGWLKPLVQEVRANLPVVAVGSRLIYRDGSVQHAGVAFARESRIPYHPYRFLAADDPRVNRRREVQAVTAACFLVRADWFVRCGRFNEEFRNGYEDLDLCLQLRRHGGVIVYQPHSVVYHLESQTAGRMKHDDQNRAQFFSKWRDWLLADEDAYYLADGYKMVYSRFGSRSGGRLMPISAGIETQQWETVAQCQRLAAEGRRSQVVALLESSDKWPADAGVRRWAGVVSRRLGLQNAAVQHWQAANAAEISPESDVLLAETGSVPDFTTDAPWVPACRAGYTALSEGKVQAAVAHFGDSLLQGMPPRYALQLEASAAWRSADYLSVKQCALALLARHRGDPVGLQLLAALEHNRRAEPPTVLNTDRAVASDENSMGRVDILSPVPASGFVSTSSAEPTGFEIPLTSIIVLVFNQLDHTRKCVESLFAFTGSPFELILVDNGSTDGTAAYLAELQQRTANICVISNRTNRGFAAGNNQGLSIARGSFVVFLNNDTIVTNGWLEHLLATYQKHPATGIVGPRSNRVSGTQQVDVGYETLAELPAFAAEWSLRHEGQSRAVSRVVGFCLMARRSVIAQIGGFDEQFGSGNFEDDDFCMRSHLAGHETRIADASFVHHVGNATFDGAKIDYRQAMMVNWGLFKRKWAIPAETPPERGYRTPEVVPPGLVLKVPLPNLISTHLSSMAGRHWDDQGLPVSTAKGSRQAKPNVLPPVAQLGSLKTAQELFRKKSPRAAWESALEAIRVRPFHPEAYLLLAEIARLVGDAASAKKCARHALELAPQFKAATKFLKGELRGTTQPEWLTLPEACQTPAANLKPRLSVCLIVKNEERFLDQCLRSVKGLADEIVVVDTGSTDRTVEIAKAHGAAVYPFTWCDDFSAARNAALEHATGDWVLALDADEELPAENQAALRQLLRDAAVMAWRLPISDAGREAEGCSYVPRLFRNAPGLHFVGRVHEQVFSSVETRCKEWGLTHRLGDAALCHHGYTKEIVKERGKVERNLRLLELAVEEIPDDPAMLLNYGLELVRSGRMNEGLQQYRTAFGLMSGLSSVAIMPETREMLLTQFCSYLMVAKRHLEVVQVLTSPLAKNGGLSASQHYVLGLAHVECNQFAEGAEQMRQCLAKRDGKTFAPINPEIRKAGPRHGLALCLWKAKEPAAADREFQQVIQEFPEAAALKLDYARFLEEQDKAVEAIQLLNELTTSQPNLPEAWLAGGQLALSKPDFIEVAVDWTAVALEHFPHDARVIAQRAEALLLSGQPEKSLPVWQQLGQDAPASVTGAIILCSAVVGASIVVPPSDRVAEISREFLRWYWHLVKFRAEATLLQLHDHVDALVPVLPPAARSVQEVIAKLAEPDPVTA